MRKKWLRGFMVLAVVVAFLGVAMTSFAASKAGRLYWTATPNVAGSVASMVYGNGLIYAAGTATTGTTGGQFAVAAFSPRTGKTVWRTPFFLRDGESTGADAATSVALQPNGQGLFAAGALNSVLYGNAFTVFALDPRTGGERWQYIEESYVAASNDIATGVASGWSWNLNQYTVCAVGSVVHPTNGPQFSTRIMDASLGPWLGWVAPFDSGTAPAQPDIARAVAVSDNAVATWGALDEMYFVVGNMYGGAATLQDVNIEAYYTDGSGLAWNVFLPWWAGTAGNDQFNAVAYDPWNGQVYAVGFAGDGPVGGLCPNFTGGIAGTCKEMAIAAFDAVTGLVLWVDVFDLTDYYGLTGVLRNLDDEALAVATNGVYVVVGGYGTIFDPDTMTGPSKQAMIWVYDVTGTLVDVVTFGRWRDKLYDQINSVAVRGNEVAFGGYTTEPTNATTFFTGYGQLSPAGDLTVRWTRAFNASLGNVAEVVNSVIFAGNQVVGGGQSGTRFYIQSRFAR